MRVYSNENFPLPVIETLRLLGHDVLTSAEADNANQSIPDEEVLQFATSELRVVLTLNRKDFIALHKQTTEHAGIVVCTFDPDFPAQADRIHAALNPLASLAGQLIRINQHD